MIPYFVVFIVAIGLTFMGQKFYRSHKFAGWLFFGASILLLSLFAALRDTSVGADLETYRIQYYNRSLNFQNPMRFIAESGGEYLFYGFTYFCSHILGSFRAMLFIIEFLPLAALYYCSVKLNPKYITFSLVAFLLMFFNSSLNVMRQTMAIAFVIMAFFEDFNGRRLAALIFILIAALFHTSAIGMLAIFPIIHLAKKEYRPKTYIFIIAVFCIFCLGVGFVSNHSDILPGFLQKYLAYTANSRAFINIFFLIVKASFLLFITFFYKFYKNDRLCRALYLFTILDLLFYCFSGIVQFGYRLSYYFVVFYAFFIPAIYEKLPDRERSLFKYGILAALSAYWFSRNLAVGYDLTIPYVLGEIL